MRNQSRIDSFVEHFQQFLHRVVALPYEPHLNVLKKLGLFATVDTFSKVESPKLRSGRARFVSFVNRFYDWGNGERISLPHLAYTLSRDTQPEFRKLKEWAADSLRRWPSRGNPSSPWWIDRDPMPNEVLGLWPKGGKILASLTPEKFSHIHFLYSRRNSLAHELRTGVSEALEFNYQHPYYRRTLDSGRNTWILHYPVGFLLALAATSLETLEEWLKTNDIDPYKHYKLGEFMLEELLEVEEAAEETANPAPAADV